MKKLIFYLTILLVIAISCTKKVYLPVEAKKYAYSEKGTYWIYKNDSLNLYDTVKAINVSVYWIEDDGESPYETFETIEIDYFSTFYNKYFYNKLYVDDINETGLLFKMTDFNRKQVFVLRFDQIENIFKCNYLCKECNYTQIDVDGKTYENVLNIKTLPDSSSMSIFIAPNFGTVRKTIYDKQTCINWNLVERKRN